MVEENISQEFRLKNIDETRNYFLEEINQSELMSRKHKKFGGTLYYIERCLFLVSETTGRIWIFAFFALEVKICAITAGIKKVWFNNQDKEKESMIKWYCQQNLN